MRRLLVVILAAALCCGCASTTNFTRPACVSAAIAAGLKCMAAPTPETADPEQAVVERLLCEAARADQTPGQEAVCR